MSATKTKKPAKGSQRPSALAGPHGGGKKASMAKKIEGEPKPKIKTVEDEPAGVHEVPAAEPVEAATKPTKTKKTKADDRKMSALDAAAKVLAEVGEPLGAKQMVEAMGAKGYWTSPGGKTPHATLYSAILREISTKGAEARFKKTDRGRFAVNG